MADEDPSLPGGRWRCEYCGCNTNEPQATQCGICSSRRIPSFLRRAGRSAASRLLASHYGIARGDFDEDEMFDDDGLEIQFREGMMGMDDEEQAVAALAMEVAGVAGAARIPGAHSALSRRRRFQAGPAPEQEDRNQPPTPTVPPETLWRFAMENASSYQPKWGTSTQHRGRMRHGHDIEVGSGNLQNVARVEDGVTEGRAVRASEPLPRAAHRSQRDHGESQGEAEWQKKIYGFRVVFDHPYRDPGMSLGDCYLVGLTSSSFSGYGERNGLMQSPHFWGIEDGGSFFEGARRRRGSRPGGASSSTGYGIELSSRDAPRNADNVLFGSQETVTVVVDLEHGTMSFWRDGDFVGTLVRNLPRSGYLYPVVVPFNTGVTFAISGMDGSPLPCVKNFCTLRKERREKEANRRQQEIAEQRSVLIRNGSLSPKLIRALENIFYSYTDRDSDTSPSEPMLDVVTASRLWYRCGLMLSELSILVEKNAAETTGGSFHSALISVDDFIQCVSDVVDEEEAVSLETYEEGPLSYEVGDKVELVSTYAKFGDAGDGPLQPGDRGTVLEVKEGPGGEAFAVHVSFNASQWWYQPHALLTERSGMIEPPSVWFLHKALRAHGYDQTTLEPLWDKPLRATCWEIGDVVVPLAQKGDKDDTPSLYHRDCFGRIAADSKDTSFPSRPRGRKSDTVLVEFMDPSFARATGAMNALADSSDAAVQLRRVPVDKLQHANGKCGQFGIFKSDYDAINKSMADTEPSSCLPIGRNESGVDPPSPAAGVVNSRLRAEIEGVSCLDPSSIQSVARICAKKPTLCSSAFASGLCEAILSAVSLAEENAKLGKVNDRMGVAVSSLGLLSSILSKGLLAVDDIPVSAVEDRNSLSQQDNDDEVDISTLLAEASSAVASDGRRSSDASRSDPFDALAARRLNAGSIGARVPLFRARARHVNSASTRSSSEDWNSNGDTNPNTRVAISNGLLRNSLPWLKASLQEPQDESKAKPESESFLSRMTNARDEHGMSLLLLAITFGCSKDIVHRLILSEANISDTEIKAAAVSNQPHLLSVLLQHSVCAKHVVESVRVTDEVAAVFRDAEARQKVQDEALRHQAEAFVSNLIASLCRLAQACRPRAAHIQRFGRAVSEALVGNVLLRALHENQRKALAACSPRRRKHGTSSQSVPETDSERLSLSLSAPWGTGDSEVFASASAMSPNHGVLLGVPSHYFSTGFLSGTPESRHDRVSALLSFTESLLWSDKNDSSAAGLTILHVLLKSIHLGDLFTEIERYGLRDLVSAHELIAGRRLADIKGRLQSSKGLEVGFEATADGSRSNKKRPRPHTGTHQLSAGEGVVLCPKFHVAELHLTKHSSFRCDLCGKGVLRDRPMHGCRECDWDACETCTDQAEGGIVKWGHILDLSSRCRKLLAASDDVQQQQDGVNNMMIDQSYEDTNKDPACPDFSGLARRLRLRDATALSELASKMETSDRMTNHEFVSFILPALHAALVDTRGAAGSDKFCLKAIGALTTRVESSSQQAQGDDDSHMSVENIDEVSNHEQPPVALANRVPTFALQRIQSVLSFSENIRVLNVMWEEKQSGAPVQVNSVTRLKSLIKPIEIKVSVWRSPQVGTSPTTLADATVFAEPLLPATELERHVILAGRIEDETYKSFCRSLVTDNAIVVERPAHPRAEATSTWRIAHVIGFDEGTGAHSLRYPLQSPELLRRGIEASSRSVPFDCVAFDGDKRMVVLAARDYVILRRTEYKSPRRQKAGKVAAARGGDGEHPSFTFSHDAIPTGVRVEANCASHELPSWLPCTVVSRSAHRTEVRYDVVSDEGEVFLNVRQDQLRGYQPGARVDRDRSDNEMYRNLRDSLDPETARNALRARSAALPFPFFRMGRNAPDPRQLRQEPRPTPESATLKRTWSAVSPLNEMTPLDIPTRTCSQEDQNSKADGEMNINIWECSIGDEIVQITASCGSVEHPPKLSVAFSAHEMLSPVASSDGETVVRLLYRLLQRSDETRHVAGILQKKNRLYYSISCQASLGSLSLSENTRRDIARIAWIPNESTLPGLPTGERRRKTFAEDSFDSDLQDISDGLDSTSLQCMEIMNALASYTEDVGIHSRENRLDEGDDPTERQDGKSVLLTSFENESLSQKLREQLEDPLMVVSGVLPEWCLTAPSLAPRVFSYASRRQLLLRTAFGVSRSTLRQQEAKVAVAPLRQRMAVLRGRAVELMGEAFSGDAEDPTVLQLQADELYGMEEALASRVNAAFRAQQWEERSLQCAKAVVRRERLLVDATSLIERYASDDRMCHRRLEVRFEGESGFDAASGTEAGVTRGFYADVAEALLNSDHVSPLNCPVSCLDVTCPDVNNGQGNGTSSIECRLPLWIPDMDSSHQVVIPTPRASPNSTLGVYPRPLLPYDGLMPLVLERFRFMGRLFAAAMRDGLMFPLQLSTSFLKLVQLSCEGSPTAAAAGKSSSDDRAIGKNDAGASLSNNRCGSISMTSGDLPRPGFLGGEVYAVEKYICAALDKLDELQPPLSPLETEERRRKIASDPQFARVALGKSYSCSFEEYFEDRVFVDPLSPTQGDDAAPLCPNGHLRQVTIDNVREWVYLAKRFILLDGVMEQAKAFRRGVDDFFPSAYLRIFTATELQRDVCGGGDKVDRWTEDDIRGLFKYDGGRGVTEALVAVAAMGGEGGASLNRRFGPSSPTIGFLVRTLLESSTTQRRQFLSFVTSVPIVTPGKIEVVPMVSPGGEFLPMREGCLPRANTCARRLYLPKFEDYESFNQVLRAVIREESKFKGFYEWRG